MYESYIKECISESRLHQSPVQIKLSKNPVEEVTRMSDAENLCEPWSQHKPSVNLPVLGFESELARWRF